MRILHIAESVKGGCGTYLNEIMPVQMADAHMSAVRAILPDAHAQQVPAVPTESLRLFRAPNRSIRSLLSLAVTIRDEVRSFRPDCIHLHSTFAGLVGRLVLATIPHRPRIIYCAHGWAFDMERTGRKNRMIGQLERLLAPLCDQIVAISNYERERGIDVGIAPERITTVLNGVADLTPPPPPERSDRRRVLFVGRLDRQKGIDVLFDAIAGLENQLEVRVVGASVVGDEQIDLAALPHVTMLGWCNQERTRAELAWAELVVIPSRWEGFGLVAIEAMRAGRAVIASAVGGLPEVVMDGETGQLVPAQSPTLLRKAILALDHERVVAMGQAGRARFVDCFTINSTTAALTATYGNVSKH